MATWPRHQELQEGMADDEVADDKRTVEHRADETVSQ